jgi:hypothetical protein
MSHPNIEIWYPLVNIHSLLLKPWPLFYSEFSQQHGGSFHRFFVNVEAIPLYPNFSDDVFHALMGIGITRLVKNYIRSNMAMANPLSEVSFAENDQWWISMTPVFDDTREGIYKNE